MSSKLVTNCGNEHQCLLVYVKDFLFIQEIIRVEDLSLGKRYFYTVQILSYGIHGIV